MTSAKKKANVFEAFFMEIRSGCILDKHLLEISVQNSFQNELQRSSFVKITLKQISKGFLLSLLDACLIWYTNASFEQLFFTRTAFIWQYLL